MRVAFIINDQFSPPGIVANVVAESGCEIIEFYPHQGDEIPTRVPEEWAGLVVFGGQMHAYEDETYPALGDIVRLVTDVHTKGVPYLGICLGAQLLARALGEQRQQMETFEMGFQQLTWTAVGRTDPILEDLELCSIMQMHGDTFGVPPGGEILLSNEKSLVQAIRVGPTSYGFQGHFEVSEADATGWLQVVLDQYGHLLDDSEREYLTNTQGDIGKLVPPAQAFGTEITRRWLQFIT